jgi:short-subunit dehydrogenase
MATALITGASAGLGAEFSRQLSADGWDVVLVARDRGRLEDVAKAARAHGVQAEVLPADLSDRKDTAKVAARLADPKRPIDLLINNAGFGTGKRFLKSETSDQDAALEVMVRALMVLSHAAARSMVTRRRGSILNVSSIAALITSGTYNAHKAWVDSFTKGLAGELEGTGVTATILRPGFVRTEFQQRAGVDRSKTPGALWLDPEPVVRAALKGARRGRLIVTPSLRYKTMAVAARIIPARTVRKLAYSRMKRVADATATTGEPSKRGAPQ